MLLLEIRPNYKESLSRCPAWPHSGDCSFTGDSERLTGNTRSFPTVIETVQLGYGSFFEISEIEGCALQSRIV
jgi:hypothetical protein